MEAMSNYISLLCEAAGLALGISAVGVALGISAVGVELGIGALLQHYLKPKQKPCDTCKHLVTKGKNMWKYSCDPPEQFGPNCFNKAPEYCRWYEPREMEKNRNAATSEKKDGKDS